MAQSPAHRFGQMIGDLLEEIVEPHLRAYCDKRGLYLDRKGKRACRKGKKVTWTDKFGRSHDLDFVIEAGGSDCEPGRPVAFIETAWRSYKKHSKAKAQEIQGAVLPIAESRWKDKPFMGAVLAGVFTAPSIAQMAACNFRTVLLPDTSVIAAFKTAGIDVGFNEKTPDEKFAEAVRQIGALPPGKRQAVKDEIYRLNAPVLEGFFRDLAKSIDRTVRRVVVVPLYGSELGFDAVADALGFLDGHDQSPGSFEFRKYEIIVRFSNGDSIDGTFGDKDAAIEFLKYVGRVDSD